MQPATVPLVELSMVDLQGWNGAPQPQRVVLEGLYARLEPLEPRHESGLLQLVSAPAAEALLRYLPDTPPLDRVAFQDWMTQAVGSQDPLFLP